MKRSDEQKRAFALKCQEIEKAGGDVLGYIELYWPSYTPRACWYNLQKQYLLRERHQLTEGKLKSRGKEEDTMRRNRETILEGVLEVLNRKGDPIEYMKEQGYANPHQAFVDLRNWANAHGKNQGRLPANLNTYYADIRRQKDNPPPAEEKPSENPTETQTTVETIFFGGKEYEKLKGENTPVNEYREKPSPTCCQPAKPSGVTVPDVLTHDLVENTRKTMKMKPGDLNEVKHNMFVADEIHAWPTDLPVCAVKSNVAGKWELARTDGFVHLIYQETQCLTLHADKWIELAQEIPKMLKQLGITK